MNKPNSIDMRKIIIAFFAVLLFLTSCGGRQKKNDDAATGRYGDAVYALYPTSNMWNFIKLNTRNGVMKMVQYTVDENADRMEYTLSDRPLVSKENERNGRFELHTTQNIYNFILLDRIDGRTWQVQWSMSDDGKAVIPITEM